MRKEKKADMTAKSLVVLVLSVLVIWVAFKLFAWIAGLYDPSMESYSALAKKVEEAAAKPIGQPESMVFRMTTHKAVVGFCKNSNKVELNIIKTAMIDDRFEVNRPNTPACSDTTKACICLCREIKSVYGINFEDSVTCDRPICKALENNLNFPSRLKGEEFGVNLKGGKGAVSYELSYEMIGGFAFQNSDKTMMPGATSSQTGVNVIRVDDAIDGTPVVSVCFSSRCVEVALQSIKNSGGGAGGGGGGAYT